MKKILLLITLLTQVSFLWGQSDNNLSFQLDKDTFQKVILAVVSATLGFLANFILARRKEKKERKQLSYEILTKEVITKEDSPIKNKIKVLFSNQEVEELIFMTCIVQNTGKVVVKDETLRFEFPKESFILEDYLEPKPEPEYGVSSEQVDDERTAFEKKYKISHLTKDKVVNFNFIIAGKSTKPNIHDYNPGGDVDFNEKSINIAKSDQQTLEEILYVNISLLLLHMLSSAAFIFPGLDFTGITNSILNSIIVSILVIYNLFFIKSIVKILSRLLFSDQKKSLPENNMIHMSGDENIVIQRIMGSSLDIKHIPNSSVRNVQDEQSN